MLTVNVHSDSKNIQHVDICIQMIVAVSYLIKQGSLSGFRGALGLCLNIRRCYFVFFYYLALFCNIRNTT